MRLLLALRSVYANINISQINSYGKVGKKIGDSSCITRIFRPINCSPEWKYPPPPPLAKTTGKWWRWITYLAAEQIIVVVVIAQDSKIEIGNVVCQCTFIICKCICTCFNSQAVTASNARTRIWVELWLIAVTYLMPKLSVLTRNI